MSEGSRQVVYITALTVVLVGAVLFVFGVGYRWASSVHPFDPRPGLTQELLAVPGHELVECSIHLRGHIEIRVCLHQSPGRDRCSCTLEVWNGDSDPLSFAVEGEQSKGWPALELEPYSTGTVSSACVERRHYATNYHICSLGAGLDYELRVYNEAPS